ncbi:MAG: T9SS type A sorting domain-containing protein [Bacteriodetes bacterium]|nr:T9SS type A sorting domain-containing protein [Bacteroidota bacterium]
MQPCTIGTSRYSRVCDTVFTLKNTSNRPIELVDMVTEAKYPWEITQGGNFFSVWGAPSLYITSPVVLLPQDSVFFTLRYNSKYVDSLSKIGFLEGLIRITYAFSDDTVYFKDSIVITCSSINNNDVISTSGTSTAEVRACNTFDTSATAKNPFLEYIYIYNKGDAIQSIDSIHYVSLNNTYQYLGVSDEDDDPYSYGKFPYLLKPNTVGTLKFRNNLNSTNLSIGYADIFIKDSRTNSQTIVHDSILSLRKFLGSGYSVLKSGYGIGYIGDSVKEITRLYTLSCSGEQLTLDSITAVSWQPNEVQILPESGLQFPITIEPEFTYNFSVSYKPMSYRRIKGFIVLHYSSADSSFKKYLRFTTFGQVRTTSVYDDYISNNISMSPNPANDFILLREMNGNKITSVSVYDVVGKLWFEKPVNSDTDILQVAQLPVGTYMALIRRSDTTLLQVPFVVMR